MASVDDRSSVEQRLRRLEDEAAIVRVLYRYAYPLDYGDESGWADLFTDDAVWHARIPGTADEFALNGHDELYEFAYGHTRAPEVYHKHIFTAPCVDVEGDTARCVSYFYFIFADPNGLPVPGAFGRYTDRFQRTATGEWRIADRLAEPQAWNPAWAALRDSRRKQLAADAGGT